jgi:hypothetical protein
MSATQYITDIERVLVTQPAVIWTKDPADVSWFQFDWSQFLAAGDTITAQTVTANTGSSLEVVASNVDGSGVRVNVKVSGGTVAASLTCLIETSEGDTFQATKTIYVRERDA